MADSRFFRNAGPFSLAEIAQLTGASLSEGANPEHLMRDVAPLDIATREDISFLDNPKYLTQFESTQAGVCLVHPKYAERAPKGVILLLSNDPYRAYAETAQHFYPATSSSGERAKSASIDKTATIGADTEIGPGACIGAHVIIGQHCVIGPNAVIANGVTIGDNTRIGANATIQYALIGNHVLIHPGVNIGQDGFGFARGPKGHMKVPQLGRVLIEDDVEIGAGTCIDRGAGPDTRIGKGAKIDNLVQIGHNVKIGSHAVIVSQVGISGSSEIGDGAVLAGQVGVAGHVKIGARATLIAKSGVTNDIPAGETYGGFPAISATQWRRQVAALSRLIKKKKDTSHE